MVEVILATDMGKHEESVHTLETIKDVHKMVKQKPLRLPLMKAILHASDISGQCIDLPVALAWEERISKEMENQARLQLQNRMELPPHMDIGTLISPQHRAIHQIGFIDNILVPLLEANLESVSKHGAVI